MKDYRKKNNNGFKIPTTSHIMIFCILLMYILVVISCLIFIKYCVKLNKVESAVQMMYALCSYSTVCGSSTIIVYANKASKENNLKIANDRYRMKIELAKEIYRSISNNTLDDKSIKLIGMLAEVESNDNLMDFMRNAQNQLSIPSTISNIATNSDDALG